MSSIGFSDIYFDIDRPTASKTFPAGALTQEQITSFSQALMTLNQRPIDGNESQVITCMGQMWRATRIESMKGVKIALRSIMSEPADSLSALGYNPLYDEIMLSPKLNKGGLILIGGATGAGKTTAAVSMVRERLMKYGGMCLTVEDPPEVLLEGEHGKGFCIQRKVTNGQFSSAVRDSLRSFPAKSGQLFFIGEIRDPETAYHAITSGINGQIVVATIHALTPISACQRVKTMAEKHSEDAADILASGLKWIFHLREFNGARMPTIFCNNVTSQELIREGKLNDLKSTIERQNTLIQSNQLPMDDISTW